jgi:branched-chain amino acid aminotransferase
MPDDPLKTPSLSSVDGRIGPSDAAVLVLPDDGLLRGDGVFEVVRAYGGKPFAMKEHLDRIERSARAISLKLDRRAIEAEAEALLREGGVLDCLLRIVCTRGGRRILALEPLPVHTETIALAAVTYTPTVILNGVKSLSYAANMHATRLAKEAGAAEALLVRPDGIVLEAPTSTLFWVSGEGPLRTTAISAGVLESITRGKLIERLEVQTGEFDLDDVLNASEAFLASTTREVQPVDSVDGRDIPTSPAPQTKAAARALRSAIDEDVGQDAGRQPGSRLP